MLRSSVDAPLYSQRRAIIAAADIDFCHGRHLADGGDALSVGRGLRHFRTDYGRSVAEKTNFSDAATAAYTVSLPQPVITPSAESTQEQPITVTIEAEGAPYIWYTTDGTDPLASGVNSSHRR